MASEAPLLRMTQIILLALVVGICGFTGVVLFLRLSGGMDGSSEIAKLLPLVVVGVAVMELPAYLVLRRTFVSKAVAARGESLELLKQGRIPMPLHTLAILGAALAEGVGLLGLVTLMIGGSWYVLAAPALAVVLILAQIPTQDRLERVVRGV